ncbi:hypothetical protein PsorP6_011230 [Peronosclerospora sorghi]|uniref:Uncharacterized protein n=1 Tax=Peronosclerospora sorghi TaxID=230839 RepID=A0ACC0VXJ4_9STRA|nr:hypothetical protein PsorP6_011230 [Peronosclerospora sorghi]
MHNSELSSRFWTDMRVVETQLGRSITVANDKKSLLYCIFIFSKYWRSPFITASSELIHSFYTCFCYLIEFVKSASRSLFDVRRGLN